MISSVGLSPSNAGAEAGIWPENPLLQGRALPSCGHPVFPELSFPALSFLLMAVPMLLFFFKGWLRAFPGLVF